MTQVPTYSYGGPGGDMPPSGARRNNGMAVGSLVCGIIALIVAWIPCINFVAALLALVGLVLGIIGWISASKDPTQKPTLAIIGIVLAVLAFIVFFVAWALVFRFGGQIGRAGIVFGAEQQANVIEQEARQRGVDEETIRAAREELQSTLDAVPNDAEQFEQAQQDVEDALDRFRERLESAPAAGESPETGEMPADQPEANEPPAGGGGGQP